MTNKLKEELFRGFAKWGFDDRGLSKTTRNKYENRARRADEWLEANRGTSLFLATPEDIKAYVHQTVPSASNRNDVRQALISFCDFMVEQGYQTTNAARALKRLPTEMGVPKAMEDSEAARLLNAARLWGLEGQVLVGVMLYAGLRRNEARLLEWRHVDWNGWLRFKHGKRKKDRVIPLHPDALLLLRRWHEESDEPVWVFPSPKYPGRPVGESYFGRMLRDIASMAGVEGVHPHKLRHTAATSLLDSGADLRTVQEFLGHADPKTTAIYTKVRPAKLRDAVDRLDFSTGNHLDTGFETG